MLRPYRVRQPVIFRHKGANPFPAYRRQPVFGIAEPPGQEPDVSIPASQAYFAGRYSPGRATGRRRIEMFQYRAVLVGLRRGESEREIARGRYMGRRKLALLRELAAARGCLDAQSALPDRTVKLVSAGSLRAGERAAAIMSLIQSARMNGHDPYAYLKDVFTRLPTSSASRIAGLPPHRWALAVIVT